MQSVTEKAKAIRLLVLDVDGVLTSGTIYYGDQGQELKGFHLHDGLGLKLLQKTGVAVAIISGKNSSAVTRRVEELNIEHAYLGYDDKLPAFAALKQKLQLSDAHIAYMGDDLPDLPLLRRVHFAITVAEAPQLIRDHAHYITSNKAGQGAVREVCELIMQAQQNYQAAIAPYLQS